MSQTTIPQSDPHASYLHHHAAILDAIIRTLDSGHLILGPQTAHFEEEFSAFLGVGETIGVGNGTDALNIALRACGIRPGDAVITVSQTAVATIAGIQLANAVPVLADIDPQSFTMSSENLNTAIRDYLDSPESEQNPLKAVVVVHLYGHPADLPGISEICDRHHLVLIEDCAQAHGATYNTRPVGTWGRAAAFSFYPTKNLGALGDGGAVVTVDPEVAAKARLLREYGWKDRYTSEIPGLNSRLDELQAAILRVRLPHLSTENATRRAIANDYNEHLRGLPITLPHVDHAVSHVFHQFVIRAPNRDGLRFHLKEMGINALVHYPFAVHQQPAYRGQLFQPKTGLPETERATREILSLPMYPQLTEEQVRRIAVGIRSFYT
ncbi:MAG: DegT/DnrJ/EryC1/StrS family aminotransferase [Verrucomicrobiota bacterium]